MSVKYDRNMQGMVEISNLVNEKVCLPLAKQVEAQIPDHVIPIVRVMERTGEKDWARVEVAAHNLFGEKRKGYLTKALGSIGEGPS